MEQPLISFCITTFKRKDYLGKTLRSIALQTYRHLEVIVSDNDVEQSGRSVVEGMNDPRFKYFANEVNLGMKKSFNRSLQNSTGSFIVMIADDDPVYPEMLETLINLSVNYPSYGMYLGGSNLYCTHPQIASLYSLKVGMNSCLANQEVDTITTFTSNEFLKNFFNFKIFPLYLWSTCMVRREILIEKGGVPDYDTAFLGDYAYLSIMASHSGCVVINTPLGHQTIHAQNFGRAQNEQIGKAAVNFIDYVSSRINHIEDWGLVSGNLNHFVASWVLAHLAFLRRYYKINNNNAEIAELNKFEKDIFKLPFMKKLRLKYYLKTNIPVLHNFIAQSKHKLSGKK